eukprot:766785-Hanusia_phi.AAC.5
MGAVSRALLQLGAEGSTRRGREGLGDYQGSVLSDSLFLSHLAGEFVCWRRVGSFCHTQAQGKETNAAANSEAVQPMEYLRDMDGEREGWLTEVRGAGGSETVSRACDRMRATEHGSSGKASRSTSW